MQFNIFRILFLTFVFSHNAFIIKTVEAQFLYPENKITGVVVDKVLNIPLPNSIVINKRTRLGLMTDLKGQFAITGEKGDTLIVNAVGYLTRRVSFLGYRRLDSVVVEMSELKYSLDVVEIFGEKAKRLEQVKKEIASREKPYFEQYRKSFEAANLMQSPITAMYLAFSKREQKNRLAEELYYEDFKKELLKSIFRGELFEKMLSDLNDEQLDEFVVFCNIPDDFIRRATEYELILFVKRKYYTYLLNQN